MLILDPILRGVALPALVAAVFWMALGRPWRRNQVPTRRFAPAPAIGGGFLIGFLALHGVPGFPPTENWQWLAYASGVGLVAGLVESRSARAMRFAVLLRASVCLAAAWVLVPAFPDLADTRWSWIAALGIVSLATWTVLGMTAHRLPAPGSVAVLFVSAGIGAVILAYFGSNAKFGQLAGALAAVLGTTLIVALWNGRAIDSRGIGAPVALVFPGLMFNGHFHDFSETPAASFFLACLAPMVLALGLSGRVRKVGPVKAAVVTVLASLVPLGIAVGLAIRAYSAGPNG